jgi:lipoprotein NlpI
LKQTGQSDKAAKLLFEHYARDVNRKKWETDLLQYHLGRISEDELINSARHKCDRCEAFFYIGYSYFLKNEKQAAMERFQKALDTNVYASWVYTGARAMLQELEAGKGNDAARGVEKATEADEKVPK